jgi:hypothetical protein
MKAQVMSNRRDVIIRETAVALPLKADVYWDEEGVENADPMVQLIRRQTARGLAEASSGILADVVNRLLSPSRHFSAREIRSGVSTYINNLDRSVPVQIEASFTILSDPSRVLLHAAEDIRVMLARGVLNWFEAQGPNICRQARIRAIRVSLWLGFEVRSYELEPVGRILLSGEGGEAGSHLYGYQLPRS